VPPPRPLGGGCWLTTRRPLRRCGPRSHASWGTADADGLDCAPSTMPAPNHRPPPFFWAHHGARPPHSCSGDQRTLTSHTWSWSVVRVGAMAARASAGPALQPGDTPDWMGRLRVLPRASLRDSMQEPSRHRRRVQVCERYDLHQDASLLQGCRCDEKGRGASCAAAHRAGTDGERSRGRWCLAAHPCVRQPLASCQLSQQRAAA
jgi:hypothetical protein